MRKVLPGIFILLFLFQYSLARTAVKDTMTRAQFVHTQTLVSDTLNQKALKLAVPGASQKDLNQAIELIMKGLHVYSKFRDSTGLRETFDHLALVYHLQKKYVQAKWFYIQSNSLSRELKDTTNIINSLLALSSVKTDIKDYSMADRDLNEALALAKSLPAVAEQIAVQQALAVYYYKRGNTLKALLALNRITFLNDSVAKVKEDKKLAVLKSIQDSDLLALHQKQLKLQKEESKLQAVMAQKQGITMVTVLIIAVITALFFILFFKRKRRRRRNGA